MVYGRHGKIKLWSYVDWSSFWTSMTDNWNCAATFSESLLYRILRNCVQRFKPD